MKKYIALILSLTVSLCLLSNTCEAKKKKKKKPASSSNSSGEVFSNLESAKHIFGPETTPKELKGKVVFLEYWGIDCPPCRASYPHLVELQKKYAKGGKFTVLASHVQSFSNKVTTFLSKEKVTFPVYQQFRESAAPCGSGIPHAALFDYRGKVIASGSPTTLYSKVAALVKATPSKMVGDVKIVYCKAQAKALDAGKSIASTIKNLERMATAGGDKGEEAKALLESVKKYLEEKKESLIAKASTEPSVALEELTAFSKKINGLEYNNEIKAKIAELKKDPSLRKLTKFRKEIQKMNAKLAKKESASTRKLLDKLKISLQKLIDSDSTTPAVAEEAKNLL